MKIIAFMVVGAGESSRYLKQVLDRTWKLVDGIAVVLNNVDQDTRDMVVRAGCTITEDNREWGKHQWRIKQVAYDALTYFKPDWILALDADEIFDDRMTRADLEEMANQDIYDSYYFYFIELWDDKFHHNERLAFWNIRFYRYLPGKWEQKPVHCGLAPRWAYEVGWYSKFIVKHFGLMKEKDRRLKIARYERFDPKATHLSHFFYSELKRGKSVEFDPNKLIIKVEEEVKSYLPREKRIMPNKTPIKKFYYIKRLSDGEILDIPANDLEDTLKQGGFEVISKEPIVVGGEDIQTTKTSGWLGKRQEPNTENQESESNQDDKNVKKVITCDLCGFIARDEAHLTSHKKHHEGDVNAQPVPLKTIPADPLTKGQAKPNTPAQVRKAKAPARKSAVRKAPARKKK